MSISTPNFGLSSSPKKVVRNAIQAEYREGRPLLGQPKIRCVRLSIRGGFPGAKHQPTLPRPFYFNNYPTFGLNSSPKKVVERKSGRISGGSAATGPTQNPVCQVKRPGRDFLFEPSPCVKPFLDTNPPSRGRFISIPPPNAPLSQVHESGRSTRRYLNTRANTPDEPVAKRRLVLASEFIPRNGIPTLNSREATTGTSTA